MPLIFQSSPDKWDIRTHLWPKKKVLWYVRNYRSLMKRGDLVLFWSAQGNNRPETRGFYGWGISTDSPIMDSEGDSRLAVTYVERWVKRSEASTANNERTAPVPFLWVSRLPSWQDHLLIKNPQGGTFIVSPEQLEELYRKLIANVLPGSQFERACKIIAQGKALSVEEFEMLEIATQEETI